MDELRNKDRNLRKTFMRDLAVLYKIRQVGPIGPMSAILFYCFFLRGLSRPGVLRDEFIEFHQIQQECYMQRYRVPGTWYEGPGTRCPIPLVPLVTVTWHLVPLVPGTWCHWYYWCHVPGTLCLVPGTMYQVSVNRYLVQDIWYWVPSKVFLVPGANWWLRPIGPGSFARSGQLIISVGIRAWVPGSGSAVPGPRVQVRGPGSPGSEIYPDFPLTLIS